MKEDELRIQIQPLLSGDVRADLKLIGKFKGQIEKTDFKDFFIYKEKVFSLLHNEQKRPRCYCGNLTKLKTTVIGFYKFCSTKCSNNSLDVISSKEKTSIERYGTKNPASSDKVKTKIKETNLANFGVTCSLSAKSVKEKIKRELLEKHNVENVMHIPAVSEKVSKAWKAKSKDEIIEINQKKQQTTFLNYGVEHPSLANEVKIKKFQTCLERYGSITALQSNRVKEERLKKYKENFVVNYLAELEQNNIYPENWSLEDFQFGNKELSFRHLDCNKGFKSFFRNGYAPICPYCKFGKSTVERTLIFELQKYFPNLIENDRSVIKPYEIDILIDNVGIEVNGTYWHREGYGIPLSEKTSLFPGKLLHFWDFEILEKPEICISIIRSKLNSFDTTFFARKLSFSKVDSKSARKFFDENHLQGYSRCKETYALCHNNEIIQAISVGKPRFTKKANLEIIRSCTKKNTQVIGGISKLISKIKDNYKNQTILTYADLRHSTIDSYSKWFSFSHISKPNYLWVKNKIRLSRYQTQRHLLKKMFDDITETDTEKSIMMRHGFHRVFDCGNAVFMS